MLPTKIKVMVVEDSRTARELLVHVLESDPAITVVLAVADGETALAAMADVQPDLITMDIHLPGIDGFEVTRRIMETQPVPIVIVSASYEPANVTKTFRALEAGAVAAVEKPSAVGEKSAELCDRLLSTVKAMAEVRVIRRWPRARSQRRPPVTVERMISDPARDFRIVAIGASTGGPPALRTILTALTKPFPIPILIVQHISAGFVQGLVDWLAGSTGVPVHIAKHGQQALPGHAYVAPDACQMTVDHAGIISCRPGEPVNGLRPAVACLFSSVASAFRANAIGVLLTGMGRDGADELKIMRDAGALTIAQDKESSIVHGMPGEAIMLGAARHILPPERIADLLSASMTELKNGTSRHE